MADTTTSPPPSTVQHSGISRLFSRKEKDKDGSTRQRLRDRLGLPTSRDSRSKSGDHGRAIREERPAAPPGSLQEVFSAYTDAEKPDKDLAKPEKVAALKEKLDGSQYKDKYNESEIAFVLKTKFSHGDVDRGYALLDLISQSQAGELKKVNPKQRLLGSVNRNNVSCYMDSTLSAMFAGMESYDGMLAVEAQSLSKKTSEEDESQETPTQEEITKQQAREKEARLRQRLTLLLRLYVNTLRSGRLVTSDLTKEVQEAIADCGWDEAVSEEQQDASEFFGVICRVLLQPLMTLKVDLFHSGQEDAKDDHKTIQERLLEVAIPETKESVTLSQCLENYFNNQVSIKRHMEKRIAYNQLQRVSSTDKKHLMQVEAIEVIDSQPSTPVASPMERYEYLRSKRPSMIDKRMPSILQDLPVVEGKDETPKTPTDPEQKMLYRTRSRANSAKMIEMPAWQFFQLLPFNTESVPENDEQVAATIENDMPTVGICLKRYTVDSKFQPIRIETQIDIPVEIAIPHFIGDDERNNATELKGDYRLYLQSAVCHRGTATSEGHYVSIVRSGTKTLANGNVVSRWLVCDDLASERVFEVDIDEALSKESPYLLFYQIRPLHDAIDNSTLPPTYDDVVRQPSVVDGSASPRTAMAQIGSRHSEQGSVARLSVTSSLVIDEPRGRTSLDIERERELSQARRLSVAVIDVDATDKLSAPIERNNSVVSETSGLQATTPQSAKKARRSSETKRGLLGFGRLTTRSSKSIADHTPSVSVSPRFAPSDGTLNEDPPRDFSLSTAVSTASNSVANGEKEKTKKSRGWSSVLDTKLKPSTQQKETPKMGEDKGELGGKLDKDCTVM